MSSTIAPRQVTKLSPLVRRVTQDNPGPMTGSGTNTYLVGKESLFVIDPGENTDEHMDALMRAVDRTPVAGIAPSHAHPDHWPLAPRLAEALRTITFGFKAHNGYSPMSTLSDGEVVRGVDWSLKVLHTPGHVSDHLSYLLTEEKALFSGDHVMGWSTSVIARPDGSLNSYLASLERLVTMDIAVIYPAHGEPVYQARARIEELIAHRNLRTRQVLEALHAGLDTAPAIVRRIYTEIDPRLYPAAVQSVLAHLDALIQSGQVIVKHQSASPFLSIYALP